MQGSENEPSRKSKGKRKQLSDLNKDLYQAYLDIDNVGNNLKVAGILEGVAKSASKNSKEGMLAHLYKSVALKKEADDSSKSSRESEKLTRDVKKAADASLKISKKIGDNNLYAIYRKAIAEAKLMKNEAKADAREKEVCSKILEIAPVTLEDHLAHTYSHWIVNGREKSIEYLKSISGQVPWSNDYRIFHELGGFLRDDGQYDKALEAFNKAYKLEPNFVKGLYHAAFILREQGDELHFANREAEAQVKYAEAEEKLKESLKLREKLKLPADDLTMYKLKEVLTLQYKDEESLEVGRKGIELFPNDSMWHDSVSTTLGNLVNAGAPEPEKLLAEALIHSNNAIKVGGSTIYLLVNKARVLSLQGEDHEALAILNQVNESLLHSKTRQEELAALESDPRSKEFAEKMLTQDRQELLQKVKAIDEGKFEQVALDPNAEQFEKEYVEALNKEIAAIEPEAKGLKRNALKVMTEGYEAPDEAVGVDIMLKINMMWTIMNKRSVEEKFMAHKASNQHLGEYIHGVCMTLTCTYTAAQATAAGMLPDTDSLASNAAAAASVLPLGGLVFSLLSSALEARQELKIKTKFGYYSAYASSPVEASGWSMDVCNKLAEQCGPAILAMKPKQGSIKKLVELFNKMMCDSKSYTYDTPWKALGHTHASIMVKEMSKNPEKSKIAPQPCGDLPDRMFSFILDNAFDGKKLDPGIKAMINEVRVALGEVKVIDVDGALDS